MMSDRPGVAGPDNRVPKGVRVALKALGYLAAPGLVLVALVLIALEVERYHERQTAQRNESATTSQASAKRGWPTGISATWRRGARRRRVRSTHSWRAKGSELSGRSSKTETLL